ncbi:MAG: UDP-N-acetylmuramate dehydrogenase [Pedobacter sp.]|nr:UDP-N-acetylmuramate dehydrogenase [Pedobacter sp.]
MAAETVQIHEHHPLDGLNTFGLPASARFFAAPDSEAGLQSLLASEMARDFPLMILGGGSNVILAGDFPGLVIQPAMKGIRCLEATAQDYLVEAAAGEVWHDFVQYALAQGWYGLENLSLIPGSVGASPIQNIGAYGVEITDFFDSLTAVEVASGKQREFTHAECRFAYRDSVFKQELADRYIITRVRFRLQRMPAVKIAYGDIQKELSERGIENPSPQQVADAVIAIRQRKLPSPADIGNAGSFFKNPVVSLEKCRQLQQQYPALVAYPQGADMKLAAGWLIDQAGWKGRRMGPVGSYEKQALVLVNHGGATGHDVLALAQAIQADVLQRFGVELEMEPRVYGVAN